jgi:peptidoglycan/xylan/chitin deacetylase (PgdA/CDA1 family)
MHTLHLILINADSAQDAASSAESEILHWGNDNNWRAIGGIASEDGADDIENHEGTRWPLSFLDSEEGVPKDGTYFQRAIAYLKQSVTDPINLRYSPYGEYPDMKAALRAIANLLYDFDPDTGSSQVMWELSRAIQQMEQILDARGALADAGGIPEFYPWQFDQEGLTDMTPNTDGAKRYLVFLDMHS